MARNCTDVVTYLVCIKSTNSPNCIGEKTSVLLLTSYGHTRYGICDFVSEMSLLDR